VGNVLALDPTLVEAARALVASKMAGRRVVSGPCVTVSRVSGLRSEGEELRARWGAVAESMEGAAAAHVCAFYDIPFLEVRGISNLVLDRDRSSWEVEEAVAAAGEAALLLCRGLGSLPLGGTAAAGEL
jgi:futalosine hydrolase